MNIDLGQSIYLQYMSSLVPNSHIRCPWEEGRTRNTENNVDPNMMPVLLRDYGTWDSATQPI